MLNRRNGEDFGLFVRLFALVFLFVLIFVFVSGVFSDDVPVYGTNFTSIQDAINLAGDGDTIKLGNVNYSIYGSQIRVNKSNFVIEGPSSGSGADFGC